MTSGTTGARKKLIKLLQTSDISELVNKLSDTTIENVISDVTQFVEPENYAPEDLVYVFSDGNCKGNGKANPVAGYSILFTEDPRSKMFDLNTTKLIVTDATNNKAELSGIKKICKSVYENYKLFKHKKIVICTDSKYSISCLTTWYKGWIENNWTTTKGEPVKNKDLIMSIIYIINKLKKADIYIDFIHVNSHLNEPADKKSLEWFFWRGNSIVDRSINTAIAKYTETHEFKNKERVESSTDASSDSEIQQQRQQHQRNKKQPAQSRKPFSNKLVVEKLD